MIFIEGDLMVETIDKDSFINIVTDIKKDIKSTQIKTFQQVNSNLINLYFRIGKRLEKNSKYGNSFIKNVAESIKLEYPGLKGFSERNLKYMKKFYLEYKDDEKMQRCVAQLPWRHNIVLMSRLRDNKVRMIYVDACVKNGWSRDVLINQINNNYHLSIGNSSNNFGKSLPENVSSLTNGIIKDPYIFDFLTLTEDYNERELETAMVERIKNVLVELGKGFSFVGNQYKISTDNNDYYIDLLFYHLELRCYVVVELKNTFFKPEYIGQLNFYVTAINKTLKKEYDNETIGLLLCREKDKLSVEWSLEDVNNPIGVSSYEIKNYIPKDILEKLPTEDDINMHINIDEKKN